MVIGAHFDTALPDYISFENYARPLLDGMGTHLLDGSLAVAIFFLLSGFFSYRTISDESFCVFHYWRKRASRILVPMWVAWVIGIIYRLYAGTLPTAPGWTLVLTVVGLDGYLPLYTGIKTYGVVGEWYTGALLVVILLWPLVRCLMRRCFFGTAAALIVAELCVGGLLPPDVTLAAFWRSPLVCMVSYVLGVCASRIIQSAIWKRFVSVRCLLPTVLIVASVILHNHNNHLLTTIAFQLCASGYFYAAETISAFWSGKLPCQSLGERLKRVIGWASGLSYQIYLFQHIVIYSVLGAAAIAVGDKPLYTMPVLVLLGIVIVITCFMAWMSNQAEENIRRFLGQ